MGCILFSYTRFENTHAAIITFVLWEVVQKIREQRHRPMKTGETALFSGILFCADCGNRLTIHRSRKSNGTMQRNCVCSKHRNRQGAFNCTAHYIREDTLVSLVLEDLRRVMSYARDYETEFVRQITESTSAERTKARTSAKCQLEKHTRRISEIDTIIQLLYEDNVKGKSVDERFSKLTAAYEDEQKKLDASVAELQKAIDEFEQQTLNSKSVLKLVRGYTEPDRLPPEILRMFLEKIVVHEPVKENRRRVQQVEIFYNFVGQLEMSINRATTRRRTSQEIFTENLTYRQSILSFMIVNHGVPFQFPAIINGRFYREKEDPRSQPSP